MSRFPPGLSGIARRNAAALSACLALVASPARGELDTPFGELGLSGFGTVGVVRSDSREAQFVRDLAQPRGASRKPSATVDSLFGLQANLRAGERLEFVVQALSRYNWEANYRPEISWAFVKFDPTPNATLRAGRLGTEFYMRADSRQVGYSYLTVRPPGDYFGTLPFNYLDGVDAALTLPLADGLLRAKLFVGSEPESLPIVGEEWKLDGSRMRGGYLDYHHGAWQWRIGAAEIRFARNFDLLTPLLGALRQTATLTGIADPARAADAIEVGGRHARMYSAGAVYDDGPLQLQLMLSQTRQGSATYENTRAGYLIGGYRIGQFTPFAGLSWTHGERATLRTGLPPVAPFAALDAALAEYLAKGHTHQETLILGSRWDFQRNLALKAQLDLVRGERDSIFLVQQLTPAYRGRLNALSLALDFVF